MTLSLPCENETLVPRALLGDAEVLDDLFRCFRDDLLRVLRSRCSSHADADDALSETFVAALKGLPTFRAEGSLQGWLTRIAQNSCRRLHRGKKNDRSITVGIGEREIADDVNGDIDRRIEAMIDTRLSHFEDAFRGLTDLDRQVLFLREGLDFSTPETAQALGVSETAVRSRLYRVRRTLRERMGSDAEG